MMMMRWKAKLAVFAVIINHHEYCAVQTASIVRV